jgi:hypothetical protein
MHIRPGPIAICHACPASCSLLVPFQLVPANPFKNTLSVFPSSAWTFIWPNNWNGTSWKPPSRLPVAHTPRLWSAAACRRFYGCMSRQQSTIPPPVVPALRFIEGALRRGRARSTPSRKRTDTLVIPLAAAVGSEARRSSPSHDFCEMNLLFPTVLLGLPCDVAHSMYLRVPHPSFLRVGSYAPTPQTLLFSFSSAFLCAL